MSFVLRLRSKFRTVRLLTEPSSERFKDLGDTDCVPPDPPLGGGSHLSHGEGSSPNRDSRPGPSSIQTTFPLFLCGRVTWSSKFFFLLSVLPVSQSRGTSQRGKTRNLRGFPCPLQYRVTTYPFPENGTGTSLKTFLRSNFP